MIFFPFSLFFFGGGGVGNNLGKNFLTLSIGPGAHFLKVLKSLHNGKLHV